MTFLLEKVNIEIRSDSVQVINVLDASGTLTPSTYLIRRAYLSSLLKKKNSLRRLVAASYTSLFRNRPTNLRLSKGACRRRSRCGHLRNCSVELCIFNRNRDASASARETMKMEAGSAPMCILVLRYRDKVSHTRKRG